MLLGLTKKENVNKPLLFHVKYLPPEN